MKVSVFVALAFFIPTPAWGEGFTEQDCTEKKKSCSELCSGVIRKFECTPEGAYACACGSIPVPSPSPKSKEASKDVCPERKAQCTKLCGGVIKKYECTPEGKYACQCGLKPFGRRRNPKKKSKKKKEKESEKEKEDLCPKRKVSCNKLCDGIIEKFECTPGGEYACACGTKKSKLEPKSKPGKSSDVKRVTITVASKELLKTLSTHLSSLTVTKTMQLGGWALQKGDKLLQEGSLAEGSTLEALLASTSVSNHAVLVFGTQQLTLSGRRRRRSGYTDHCIKREATCKEKCMNDPGRKFACSYSKDVGTKFSCSCPPDKAKSPTPHPLKKHVKALTSKVSELKAQLQKLQKQVSSCCAGKPSKSSSASSRRRRRSSTSSRRRRSLLGDLDW